MHELRVRLVSSNAEEHSVRPLGARDPVLHHGEEGDIVVRKGLLRLLDRFTHCSPIVRVEVGVLRHVRPGVRCLLQNIARLCHSTLGLSIGETMLERVAPAVHNEDHTNIALVKQQALEHVVEGGVHLLLGWDGVRALVLGVAFCLLGQWKQTTAKVDADPVSLLPGHVGAAIFLWRPQVLRQTRGQQPHLQDVVTATTGQDSTHANEQMHESTTGRTTGCAGAGDKNVQAMEVIERTVGATNASVPSEACRCMQRHTNNCLRGAAVLLIGGEGLLQYRRHQRVVTCTW